jgi:hypothetical protein
MTIATLEDDLNAMDDAKKAALTAVCSKFWQLPAFDDNVIVEPADFEAYRWLRDKGIISFTIREDGQGVAALKVEAIWACAKVLMARPLKPP